MKGWKNGEHWPGTTGVVDFGHPRGRRPTASRLMQDVNSKLLADLFALFDFLLEAPVLGKDEGYESAENQERRRA